MLGLPWRRFRSSCCLLEAGHCPLSQISSQERLRNVFYLSEGDPTQPLLSHRPAGRSSRESFASKQKERPMLGADRLLQGTRRLPYLCRELGGRPDSNRRPPGPQPGALPTELRPPRWAQFSGPRCREGGRLRRCSAPRAGGSERPASRPRRVRGLPARRSGRRRRRPCRSGRGRRAQGG